ncbi:MAG: ATP-dependent DNA helicase RecG [Gammaproteobacteria bacterium]|nr:ATP-dependent DNA helicase RecG [Gammaproteobacteria bacterium]
MQAPATSRRSGSIESAVAPPLESTPITELRGVGPGIAARLATIGIETVLDVLFHLPSRYEDRTRIHAIGDLSPGHTAFACGRIESASVRFGRRRSLVAAIGDGTGTMSMRLFHFNENQRRQLRPGRRIACYGEVRSSPGGIEMVHPEYRLLGDDAEAPITDRLTPVYPAATGLGQALLRRLVEQALDRLERSPDIADLLPGSVAARHRLVGLGHALRTIHRPPAGTSAQAPLHPEHPARRRLAFEELLAQHLALRVLRRRLDLRHAAALDRGDALAHRLIESLPFELTAAQRRVVREVRADLARTRPMHRLVQGDVGAGKTVVAALAAVVAVANQRQVALMAPTELLAEQHCTSFRGWLEPLGIDVVWLSGRLSSRERGRALADIADGHAAVAVGTHALFQSDVAFANLGLVIVDEQHRFGVEQRLALRGKGERDGLRPHQLIMTATPIPRTLAMTAYADLDTSVIDELPPGRTPADTAVAPSERRPEIVARIRRACVRGEQAYWVCTAIEESEALACRAAEDTARELAEALPGLRVGLVHGRMPPAEKDVAMAAFKEARIDVLVATTVIEVGVDVPNASLMIIENAERLGLAQLHQLRGRVGRGARRSACVMMYDGPLTETARARLEVLRATTDGFEIAQRDLEIRGPGELLGTRQTGLAQLRIADLARDLPLLPGVERAATELLQQHESHIAPLIRRWVGPGADYGQV